MEAHRMKTVSNAERDLHFLVKDRKILSEVKTFSQFLRETKICQNQSYSAVFLS